MPDTMRSSSAPVCMSKPAKASSMCSSTWWAIFCETSRVTCWSTFPLRYTECKKMGKEKVITKDNHEALNSARTPLKNKAMTRTTEMHIKTKMPLRTTVELPATHTRISNTLRFNCVTECAIARCISQVDATGFTNFMHETTILLGKSGFSSLEQFTASCCLLNTVRKCSSEAKQSWPSKHWFSGKFVPTTCSVDNTQCCHKYESTTHKVALTIIRALSRSFVPMAMSTTSTSKK
mmetsp:Transcript_88666/g.271457  ORF Transcript_88666/g.271457 Transcript_88666/m.271457 type:complete len:235 (-) Transcript_88666:165-869(-)